LPSFQCQVELVEGVVEALQARCADFLADRWAVLAHEKQAAVAQGLGIEAVLATLQREFLGG
jgi:hypothetical protein